MTDFFNQVIEQLWGYYYAFAEVFPQLILGVVILTITFLIAHQLKKWTDKRVRRKAKDPLLAGFIGQAIRLIVIVIGLVISLGIIGLGGAASKILAGAGITAFILGFAFKDIGENFLAGILMAFKRPFSVGDTIETNGVKGKIIGLNMRETILKTLDGKDVYIPNGMIIKNPLYNYTIDGFLRQEFVIGIDYDERLGEAISLIKETIAKIDGVLGGDRKPNVLLNDLGTSAVNIIVQFWIDTYDQTQPAEIKSEVIHATMDKLTQGGFYMPGEVMEIKNYKSSSLSTAAQAIKENVN